MHLTFPSTRVGERLPKTQGRGKNKRERGQERVHCWLSYLMGGGGVGAKYDEGAMRLALLQSLPYTPEGFNIRCTEHDILYPTLRLQ
jgi:hypothetical protein